MQPTQIIALLNAIEVGEMRLIHGRLEEARRACLALAQADLADKLVEARTALDQADMKTYRKRIETVVSRLGHLK
jgi:hypothetical protein